MNGFIIFLIFIFVVLPMLTKTSKKKKAVKGGPTKPMAKPTPKPSWKYGHSDTQAQKHRNLHQGDGDTNVYTKDHARRVAMRDRRDKAQRLKMEMTVHGKNNFGIKRAGNRGRDDWGTKGDSGSIKALIPLMFLLGLGYAIIRMFASGYLDIGRMLH